MKKKARKRKGSRRLTTSVKTEHSKEMILKFRNTESRDRFLEITRLERPALVSSLRIRRILPHITASDLRPEDTDWILSRIPDFGRAYADLKMDFDSSGISKAGMKTMKRKSAKSKPEDRCVAEIRKVLRKHRSVGETRLRELTVIAARSIGKALGRAMEKKLLCAKSDKPAISISAHKKL